MQGGSGKPHVTGEFLVAAYQRGYRWGRDEVRQLLDDIRLNALEAEERQRLPEDYYLQPIVVLQRDGAVWELVDGQQRLTTLFLVTKYIRTHLPNARLDYSLTYETRPGSREYLEDLDVGRRTENIDFHHIAQAYDAIEEWFGEQPSPVSAAIEMHGALSKWVYVIWYEAPADTDPHDLFTRLNRDRIPLTDAELIKALVLTPDRSAGVGAALRQEEAAAQWDTFERDLRDEQFWAFLTASGEERSTHIDFLFETMTPSPAASRARPRYYTFLQVQEKVKHTSVAAFWREVVALHGLLVGWFRDRKLHHQIGYLVALGEPIPSLVAMSGSITQSRFRHELQERIRGRLNLTRERVSLLKYGRDDAKCAEVLLLMNVETVLRAADQASRFSFHAYAQGQWSLEHVHAQNAENLKTDMQWRAWLETHLRTVRNTPWASERQQRADEVENAIRAMLGRTDALTDGPELQTLVSSVFTLFSLDNELDDEEELHGVTNLALLQREHNSSLNNAVFEAKRKKIVELDFQGDFILPCTRNVFLKYYSGAADHQLHFWSGPDREAYGERMLDLIEDYLLPDPEEQGR